MQDEINLDNAILYADSNRGQYIPQHFVETVKRDAVSNVSPWAMGACEAGPEAEEYWEAWDEIERDAIVTDSDGKRFRLYHDGDLWLVPEND